VVGVWHGVDIEIRSGRSEDLTFPASHKCPLPRNDYGGARKAGSKDSWLYMSCSRLDAGTVREF
jgi:hypothetical protein